MNLIILCAGGDENNVDNVSVSRSPESVHTDDCSSRNTTSPVLKAYQPTMKVLSKGSKKWIADDSLQLLKPEAYNVEKPQQNVKGEGSPGIVLDVEQSQAYNPPKMATSLGVFNRQETSNASLLVEAALDSVCSEPIIDIDVNSTTNCTEALVNNLYTLSNNDALPDVTYSHSVDMGESRDINLMSPSVNDHVSVTDDLNDELKQSQTMGIDYSSFHQDDFSSPNSPALQNRNDFVQEYINVNVVSPQNNDNYEAHLGKNNSPTGNSPRYDFGHAVSTGHVSSDESNGVGVQNLSIHNTKDNIQLDLSIYKSHYNIDPSNFPFRKDFRLKLDNDIDRKQLYVLDVDNISKSYNIEETHNMQNAPNEMSNNDNIDGQLMKHKEMAIEPVLRPSLSDIRKFDFDLDLRTKSYDNIDSEMRNRNMYDGTIDDFRIKSYDLMDNIENRTNMDGRNLLDNEFSRSDRSFDHLILNPSDLQGLDMSARGFHNYSNLNRYHHLYSDVDRPSVDLRLNYNSPPPTYTHTDILRVVSLDLTPPGRHSVDLSLRSHQITNSRLLTEHSIQSSAAHRLIDQNRLLSSDLGTARHMNPDSRLISVNEISNRMLSDHTTNRLLSNDQIGTNRLITSEQRLMPDDTRLIPDQQRLLDQGRLLSDTRIMPSVPGNSAVSPIPYNGYSVSPTSYHPTALARPHATSPNSTPYHHYSAYY